MRTKTLVKNAIIQIDATPFKQWYAQHYGIELGTKKPIEEVTPKPEDVKVRAGLHKLPHMLPACEMQARGQQAPIKGWRSSLIVPAKAALQAVVHGAQSKWKEGSSGSGSMGGRRSA